MFIYSGYHTGANAGGINLRRDGFRVFLQECLAFSVVIRRGYKRRCVKMRAFQAAVYAAKIRLGRNMERMWAGRVVRVALRGAVPSIPQEW